MSDSSFVDVFLGTTNRQEPKVRRHRKARLSPEERRANRRAYMLKWRAENAEWQKEYKANYKAEHREETSAYNAAYHRTHKHEEGYRARKRRNGADYRARHPERHRQRHARHYARNRPQILAYCALLYLANTDRILARTAAWRKAHPDEKRQMNAAWWKAHPEKVREHNKQRRAAKANAPINDFTDAEWHEVLRICGYRCVYCPDDCPACHNATHTLTQDHVTPYSKGGSNTLHNIVPACPGCNSRKKDGPVPKPVQPLLLTLAPAKKKKGSR